MENNLEKSRTFVCSDTHGAGLELEALLRQIKLDSNDTLIMAGDNFDRACHGHLVWNVIHRKSPTTSHLKNPVICLLGNHEAKMMKFLSGYRAANKVPPHYHWCIKNLEAHGVSQKELLDFCRSLRFLHVIEDHKTIIAHAGVDIENPLRPNESFNVYCGGMNANTKWWDLYNGPYKVVYGHLTEQDYSVRYKFNSIGIDTATCHGGPCTAYEVETGTIHQFKSGIDWAQELKESRYLYSHEGN